MIKDCGGFSVNADRALWLARTSIGMLEAKVYPFDRNRIPDAIVPEGIEEGSLEHALLLFYGCCLDANRNSEKVWEAARAIAREIDLRDFRYYDALKVRTILSKVLERPSRTEHVNVGDPVGTLVENSKHLVNYYNGDPREIAFSADAGLLPLDFTRKRLGRFAQFKTKNHLFIKNMVRFGMWPYNPAEIPIKPDRHVKRIAIGTGVIRYDEGVTEMRSEKLGRVLSKLFEEIIKEERISAVKLDDALWAIGHYLCTVNSMGYCRYNCDLGCKIRPSTNSHASLYFSEEMRRREPDSETQTYLF